MEKLRIIVPLLIISIGCFMLGRTSAYVNKPMVCIKGATITIQMLGSAGAINPDKVYPENLASQIESQCKALN